MKSKFIHLNAHLDLKWKTDLEKSVIIENMNERNWEKADEDEDDWNIMWANVNTVRQIFNPKFGFRLTDDQLINHFPNFFELTRKDLMAKNVKRYKRELEKENGITLNNSRAAGSDQDFLPQTYILPQDYSIFQDDFNRHPNKKWIVKPAGRSQGKGIMIITKLAQVKNLSSQLFKQDPQGKDNFVVSRYIDNPMLVGGKKFDLRLYILITNYKPLRIWKYENGFARFCNETYDTNCDDPENMYAHLTNVAIQKTSDKYSESHGGKWSLESVQIFIELNYGRKKVKKLLEDMQNIYIQSAKSVQGVIFNDKHCFEMYGFDIMIDANCKPWLIEINSSPAQTTTTKEDKIMKKELLNDIFNIVIPHDWLKNKHKVGADTCKDTRVGKFLLIHDESNEKTFKNNSYLKKNTGQSNRVNTPKYLGRKTAQRI